jgi:hypothetical protein
MAGKRKGINLKIYKLLVQSPAMPRVVVLSKLGLGEEHTVSVYRIRNEVRKEWRKKIRAGSWLFSPLEKESVIQEVKQTSAEVPTDIAHMQQAYNMLSRHHDACLARIADLERQNDMMFGWGYLWKWLARRVKSRARWE